MSRLEAHALPFTRTLEDGTEVLVRYLEPADREELRRGFLRLSGLSRWLRFASPIRRLSEGQLSYLTEVDQVDHVAVGVRDEGHPQKAGVAVGRCVRLTQEPAAAEFAITVVDDYHNRGIGSLLLRVLASTARGRGIHSLRGYVLESNRPMVHILERFGARFRRRFGGMLEAELELPLPPEDPAVGAPRGTSPGGPATGAPETT